MSGGDVQLTDVTILFRGHKDATRTKKKLHPLALFNFNAEALAPDEILKS
jgi:hypothetical protein